MLMDMTKEELREFERGTRPGKYFDIPLDKLDSYQGRKAVAKLIRKWEREAKDNTFRLLSKKSQLSYKTVCNVAGEVTVWPRFHTIIALLSAVGFSRVVFYE